MTTYSSIINNTNAYISQLLLPEVTGVSGATGSLPNALGSIAFQKPDEVYVNNGSNWILLAEVGATGGVGQTGPTGPAVSLEATSEAIFFNNNSGITGAPPGSLLDISYLTGSNQTMIGFDLLFNTTFAGDTPISGIATLSTSVAISSQYIPSQNKTFAGTMLDALGTPVLLHLELDNTGLFHIDFSVSAQTYSIESISGIYKAP